MLLASGLAVYAYGVVGFLVFGHGLIEAIYQTGLTLTTVGYGASPDLRDLEKMFVTSLALVGLVLYLFGLAVIASVVSEGRYVLEARRRRMLRRISSLHNHVIVCAYGRVGRAAVDELLSEGVPCVVIDPNERVVERMENEGLLHLVADPTNTHVLMDAGIKRARALVSAVDSDATNVFITMAARALSSEVFIVARSSEPDSAAHLYRAGANRVISPYVASGRHMALMAQRPRVVDYLDIAGLGDATIRIEEVRVDDNSPLIGRTVEEVADGSAPLLLRRRDCRLRSAPTSDTELAAGDVLVLVRENPNRSPAVQVPS